MHLACVLAVARALVARAATAQSPLFDSHVHRWNGEESLRAYEEQLKEGRLDVAGIGAVWFGGPNQALAGQAKQIRAGNDRIIALAATWRPEQHRHDVDLQLVDGAPARSSA